MRKKYLSALLFGALLFASAGTFTSCKDYDDDINNLQEQIDKVAADLESLKATVDQLGGVQDVKVEGGKLLVTAGGETISYDLPTGEGSDVDKTVVELDGQDLKVDGQVIGQVGDKVTVNADGYLCVNGEPTEIKAGKYAIIDNESENSVTITLPDANGELKTIELAKYSPADKITSIIVAKDSKFDSDAEYTGGIYPIQWTKAAVDQPKWEGKKGKVTRNQLMVGNISNVEIQVLPADVDLNEVNLSLRNSLGEIAPVKVIPTPNDKLLKPITTRAVSNNGSWNLTIEMDETVTPDNIAKKFEKKYGERKDQGLKYALYAGEKAVTGYDFEIDVNNSAVGQIASLDSYLTGFKYIDSEGYYVEIEKGTVTPGELPLNQATDVTPIFDGGRLCHLYDSYITFEGTNKSLAASKGISADGMTITTTAASAGTIITATVHMMDITGHVYDGVDITFKVASSTAVSPQADNVDYVVMPTKVTNDVAEVIEPIAIVNLEEVFSQIDAATLQKVKGWDQISIVEEKDQTGFLIASNGTNANGEAVIASSTNPTIAISNALFMKADGEAWDATTDDLADLATIKLPFEALTKDDKGGSVSISANTIAADAKPSNNYYTLYLVATANGDDTTGNEIIRIKMNVKIALPAFSDLFTKAEANWKDGKFVARIAPNGTLDTSSPFLAPNAVLTMSSAYNPVNGTNAETSRLSYVLIDDECKYFDGLKSAYNTDELNAIVGTEGIAKLKKDEVYKEDNTKLALTELHDVVAYTSVFAGMKSTSNSGKYTLEAGADVEAIQEAFTIVSDAYNVTVKTALDGIKAGYFKAGELVENHQIQLDANEFIKGFPVKNGKPDSDGEGFGFQLEDTYISGTWDSSKTVANYFGSFDLLGGYGLFMDLNGSSNIKSVLVIPSTEQINVNVTMRDFDGAGTGTINYYQVTGLQNAQSTTVTFTFTDRTGFKYTSKVTVVK